MVFWSFRSGGRGTDDLHRAGSLWWRYRRACIAALYALALWMGPSGRYRGRVTTEVGRAAVVDLSLRTRDGTARTNEASRLLAFAVVYSR